MCEAFFTECIKPVLLESYPNLPYSAALIGSGSEVLGLDTVMSSDHDWGPRGMLFIEDKDFDRISGQLKSTLIRKLPATFRSYSTNFGVSIFTLRSFFDDYLGININEQMSHLDWLTIPQQKLLGATAGAVFQDQIGLNQVRAKFTYYPQQVWLYMLASAWARIEQEEHLMGRAGYVGDELGSALIGARLVRDLMQLLFLMEKKYAPYPKWFGTAFQELPGAEIITPYLRQALEAHDWQAREKGLVKAYEFVAERHNQLQITKQLPTKGLRFHDRPFTVISTGQFSQSIADAINEPELAKLLETKHLIGNIDQFSDSTDLKSSTVWRAQLSRLYSLE